LLNSADDRVPAHAAHLDRITSIDVGKVRWPAQECGVPFARTGANRAFGIARTEADKALHPNALECWYEQVTNRDATRGVLDVPPA
jgi:hypothetical protein